LAEIGRFHRRNINMLNHWQISASSRNDNNVTYKEHMTQTHMTTINIYNYQLYISINVEHTAHCNDFAMNIT